jgi:hypothetical protein
MTRRRFVMLVAIAVIVVGALAYLRDPPWLLTTTSGLGDWQSDAGTRFRWMGGHASFFVQSDRQVVIVPLRATFDRPADWPIVATVTIDDRPADRVVLSDSAWRRCILRMPRGASRRTRRIDIRVNRMRDNARGAQVGEIEER